MAMKGGNTMSGNHSGFAVRAGCSIVKTSNMDQL